ncbi:hypothetical protein FB45DRAFT_1054528, partial [Roridomyces roridus]
MDNGLHAETDDAGARLQKALYSLARFGSGKNGGQGVRLGACASRLVPTTTYPSPVRVPLLRNQGFTHGAWLGVSRGFIATWYNYIHVPPPKMWDCFWYRIKLGRWRQLGALLPLPFPFTHDIDSKYLSVGEYLSQGSIMRTTGGGPSALFTGARDFSISGGIFASNLIILAAAPTPCLRPISRGDIRLTRETRLDHGLGVAHRFAVQSAVQRRMYCAKVHGEDADMTVFVFGGQHAEEEKRQYVSQFAGIWHQNILQIFGLADCSGTYAVVVYDDLLPYQAFLDLHRPSPVMMVFLRTRWDVQWKSADEYLTKELHKPYPQTTWVHRSDGRLCVDLARSDVPTPVIYSNQTTVLVPDPAL